VRPARLVTVSFAAAGIAAAALACCAPPATAAPAARTGPAARRAGGPAALTARGADLVNAAAGQSLWSRGLNAERPMASITKVMTALVVLRAGGLGREITITPADVSYVRRRDGSSAGLRAGDVLTARQLLEGLLLPSGCDAALALARAYGPGWPAFVAKMNATARALGMGRTHFANFDGLPWPTEDTTYSTPRDLITLGLAAMRRPVFRAIVAQRTHYLPATAEHQAYFWTNTNWLLGAYPGAFGIKTGFTLGAGYSLLFGARRDGHTLIGVVLDTSTTNPAASFAAAARLLNWGFRA